MFERDLDCVFVLAPVYRSGSTLLQRVLNTCDDLIIWGENGDLPHHLSLALDGMDHQAACGGSEERKRYVAGERNFITSHMVPPREAMLDAFRSMLVKMYRVEGKRWGFKEVRCGSRSVGLLNLLFPSSRFIFLVRHPLDTFLSYHNVGWVDESFELLTKAWPERVSAYLEFAKANPDRSVVVRYEDLNLLTCKDLFERIGISFNQERIGAVLRARIGGSNLRAPLSDRQRQLVLSRAKPVLEELFPSDLKNSPTHGT